ncbi:MAG: NAD-dependent epimerase/dehydratase family protein [Halieaceae bacterium]|nr:NAD-dependent epimerase/dehydratase family protein [Halieaceae bacterium]MCP5202742.1 NAD-dependent epimerase/dehydratase family protein [Pseudomonadales bacterium]
MKCLVTGATGFIGRDLCQRLTLEGHSVTALSRTGSALPDGTPTEALDLAHELPGVDRLRGIDAVFHLAGIAHQQAPATAYRTVNEQATVALARRCAEAGVGRFVYVSSVKAMGPASTDTRREESDCQPPVEPYGESKWRAECALRETFRDAAMQVVILRPALVYGLEPKGNLALLARGVRRGLPRPPAGGGRSLVALEDLVEAMLLVSRLAMPGVPTFIVADPRPYSTRALYDQLRLAAGKGTGRAWLPRPLWRLAAAVLDRLGGQRGDSTWHKLFGTELYSAAALTRATGWQPRVSFGQLAPRMLEPRTAAEQGS